MLGYTGQFQHNVAVHDYIVAYKAGNKRLAKRIEKANGLKIVAEYVEANQDRIKHAPLSTLLRSL